jgi:hypothetical protein
MQRSVIERMAPKADVEGVVNPVHNLQDDDDPFLVSLAYQQCNSGVIVQRAVQSSCGSVCRTDGWHHRLHTCSTASWWQIVPPTSCAWIEMLLQLMRG